MSKILLCKACHKYTMKDRCPICSKKTVNPDPPRFSPQDKYGAYIRKMKNQIEKRTDSDE